MNSKPAIPWKIVNHSWEETSIYADDDNFPICKLEINCNVTEETQTKYEKEMDQRATLIAATPVLLDALEKLVSDIENGSNYYDAMQNAYTAISLAKSNA